MNENMGRCSKCSCVFPKDTLTLLEGGPDFQEGKHRKQYCTSCYNSYRKTCKFCGRKFYPQDTQHGGDFSPVYEFNIETLDRTELCHHNEICEDCLCDVMSCDLCKEYVLYKQMRMNTDENLVCAHCFEMDHDCILAYNDKPKYTFLTETKPHERCSSKIFYMGVELESEGSILKKRTIDAIIKHNRTLIFKEDSSLDEGGFEIISQPATLIYHKNYMQWKNVFYELNKYKYDSTLPYCGIHIHFNKNFLNFDQELRFIYFIYTLPNKMKRIGNRVSDYSKFLKLEPYRLTAQLSSGRHVALNIKNQDTLELRIFRGTMDETILFAYLEFCEAAVKFCKCTRFDAFKMNDSAYIRDKVWYAFLDYAKTKNYKIFLDYWNSVKGNKISSLIHVKENDR